jgi:Uma2 family endonuclease
LKGDSAEIAEYWVLDLNTRRVFVHREPAQGSNTKATVYSSEERVATLAAPEAEFAVADLFPAMAAEA